MRAPERGEEIRGATYTLPERPELGHVLLVLERMADHLGPYAALDFDPEAVPGDDYGPGTLVAIRGRVVCEPGTGTPGPGDTGRLSAIEPGDVYPNRRQAPPVYRRPWPGAAVPPLPSRWEQHTTTEERSR